MKKIMKHTTLLSLTMIIIIMFGFNVIPVQATGTIYLRDNGSIDPPSAPITENDGVYTFTADIVDSIVVEIDGIVIDGAGYTLTSPNSGLLIGIDLTYRNDVTVKNLHIIGFEDGIYLDDSSFNIITGNTITGTGTTGGDIGIHALESGETSSVYNIIYGNTISNNFRGISFYYSEFNTIYENQIVDNQVGVWIQYTRENMFYHNDFDNNVQIAVGSGPETCSDLWDNGEGGEGNYWSDYEGTDGNGDGIGDTPYIIDSSNQDNFPLMEPYVSEYPPPTEEEFPFEGGAELLLYGVEGEVEVVGTITYDYPPLPPLGDSEQLLATPASTSSDSNGVLPAWDIRVTGVFESAIVGLPFPEGGSYSEMWQIDLVLGDVNHDGTVDRKDIVLIFRAYGSSPDSRWRFLRLRWNPDCDLNGDDKVNLRDLYIAWRNFGETAEWQPVPNVQVIGSMIYGEPDHFSIFRGR